MPWEKQFDEAAALDKAMEAFWARGYEATSVQDLVEAMGLHRGSIYAAFGGKRSLFLKALRHYETHRRRAWLEALRRRHGPRAAILSVFEAARRDPLGFRGGDRRGALRPRPRRLLPGQHRRRAVAP
jgi:TetR/AcrR family transcriptional repressor of nem operon